MTVTLAGGSSAQRRVLDRFVARHERDFAAFELTIAITRLDTMQREHFRVHANRDGAAVSASAAVSDAASFRWALNALRAWLVAGAEQPLELEDRPDFRWRGVIEGFYGHPWTHEQRLRGVDHFADFGMNLFLLAPKDAAWQRLRWREPLSADFVEQIRALIERGSEQGVDVSACVSPGLSVEYSRDSDVDAVVAKFAQLHAIGATHFGLLLDDIPDTLSHPSDLERYASVAHAHADFANRVHERMVAIDARAHVILCPMHYAGRGTEPYLQVMGDQLHPRIELMWTGREICNAYLDISDAVVFERTTRRPPFYWDNYPVNDGAMLRRLHIGPYHGREAGLQRYSAGLLANPMEFFEASLLPLGTIGAYLWRSADYDPFVAWDAVLRDLIPDDEDRFAAREFFRNALGLTGAWAPAFNVVLDACATAWRGGLVDDAASAARGFAVQIRANLARIDREDFSAPALRDDVRRWLDKYGEGATLLDGFADALGTCRAEPSGGLLAPIATRARVEELRQRFNADSTQLFGDGFDMMLFTFMAEVAFVD